MAIKVEVVYPGERNMTLVYAGLAVLVCGAATMLLGGYQSPPSAPILVVGLVLVVGGFGLILFGLQTNAKPCPMCRVKISKLARICPQCLTHEPWGTASGIAQSLAGVVAPPEEPVPNVVQKQR